MQELIVERTKNIKYETEFIRFAVASIILMVIDAFKFFLRAKELFLYRHYHSTHFH